MKTQNSNPSLLSLAALVLLLPVWAAAQAPSAVPGTISYQGRVLDTSGTPVGAGTPVNRTVIFRIWDSASSTAQGNLLYSESQTVTISEGEFSVLVGQGQANATQTFSYAENGKGPPTVNLANVFNGAERYLGVTVAAAATIATSDSEISPRQQIVGSAFAFRARVAESLSAGTTTALSVADGGNVGIGTTTPAALLSLGSTFNNTKLALFDNSGSLYGFGVQDNQFRMHLGGNSGRFSFMDSAGGTELMTLTGTGNLGLGTNTPVSSLAYALGWRGMHINTGTLPGVSIVEGSGQARLHLRNATNTLDFTRDLCLTNEGNIAALRWMGAGLGPRVAIFTANSDGDMTFARNGTFSGALTATSAIINGAASITGTLSVTGATTFSSSGTFTGALSALTVSASSTTGNSLLKGNVGIGDVTTPACRLDVNGQVQIYNSSTLPPTKSTLGGNGMRLVLWPGSTSDTPFGFGIDGGTLYSVVPDSAAHKWYTGTSQRMVLNSEGFLGIRTTDPKAPLHVRSTGNTYYRYDNRTQFPAGANTGTILSTSGIWIDDGGAATIDGGSNTWGNSTLIPYSSIAAVFEGETVTRGTCWLGNSLAFNSDVRAKNVTGISNGGQDLAKLLSLEVTDYTWIDHAKDGHRPHKRLIAQQVQEVFPQAVNVMPQPQTIPSVYEFTTKATHDATKGLLSLTTKKAHGFQAGDVIDLYLEKSEMKGVKVESVSGAHEFTVKSETAAEKVFVYGKQVKDFLTVDYDAISMLNVSATQQLKKEKDAQVAALEAENAKLNEKLAAQEKRLKALEAADKARDAKLAALERLLDGEAKPAARTVLLKKDTGAE